MSINQARPTRIMSALILRAIVDELTLPEFEKDGSKAEMVWDPTLALMERIKSGERADAIVAIDWALDKLEAQGIIDGASRRRLAQASFGLAVMAGSPKPDISTAERLRQTLLDVPSLVYSRSGASGVYFEKLIDRLGIGDQIRAKASVIPAGLTGELVANGQAVLAIQQISELLAVPGVDLVGPFPKDVQETTDFSVALFAEPKDTKGAKRFIEVLFSPRSRQKYIQSGLVPFFA
jgi:molybdate transport system substrate-binding protein